jgi:branched-chain amino acid transport system permease protein
LVWLHPRWGLLAIFVVVAAVGRFIVVAFVKPHLGKRKLAKAKAGVPEVSDEKGFFHTHFLKIALAGMLIYPFVAVTLAGTQGSLKWSTTSASRSSSTSCWHGA